MTRVASRYGVRGLSKGASTALLGSIAAYRSVVSPWLPARCRFHPSCSAYAAEAITTHGPLAGIRLAIARVARCHPWHAGGHDPVPPATGERVAASAAPKLDGPVRPGT